MNRVGLARQAARHKRTMALLGKGTKVKINGSLYRVSKVRENGFEVNCWGPLSRGGSYAVMRTFRWDQITEIINE